MSKKSLEKKIEETDKKIEETDKKILEQEKKIYDTVVEHILDKYAIKDVCENILDLKKELKSEKEGLEEYLTEKTEKETLKFMNDPKRGYDCKWNSLGRRGRGNSLYAIFKLLDEKSMEWGHDYGVALTKYLDVYKEKENAIWSIKNEISDATDKITDGMSVDERIIIGKYLHEHDILSLGCSSYGTYKKPTTCGACHAASNGLSKLNLLDVAESVGDRTYRISEKRINKALKKVIENG